MRSDDGASAVKRAHTMELMSRPGVVGVGVEHDADGQPILVIHVDSDDPRIRAGIPDQIEDYPVKLVVQPGGFRKLPLSS
jgi:hypothetical protein